MVLVYILLAAIAILVLLANAGRILGLRADSSTSSPDEPYGRELAERVADRLERGEALVYAHREYCGMGLCYTGSQYVYGEVMDGLVIMPADLASWGVNPSRLKQRVFDSREAFVAWLAQQSDESLYGYELDDPWRRGNQRITRARLEAFVRGERQPGT